MNSEEKNGLCPREEDRTLGAGEQCGLIGAHYRTMYPLLVSFLWQRFYMRKVKPQTCHSGYACNPTI